MFDDKEVVSGILAGDARAFRQLVEQHQRLVFCMINRLVADPTVQEDLCQDIFLKVYKNIHRFSFRSKLSTWIARIAYLSAVNEVKRRQRHSRLSYRVEVPDLPSGDHTPEDLLTGKEGAAWLHVLIRELPLHYQTVLNLYHLNEFSIPEISEITGMPEGSIKSYLYRARQLLKTRINEYLKKEIV